MPFIKRGTTPTITVQITGITPEDAEKIEFIFKHQKSEYAREICAKVYPGEDVSYHSDTSCFHIALTDAETRLFQANNTVYMDTRITLVGGTIPATEIVSFGITDTLFRGTEND